MNEKAVLKATVRSSATDDLPSRAASLAYYTVFSLAPTLTIVVALAGAVFGHKAARRLVSRTTPRMNRGLVLAAVCDMPTEPANAAKKSLLSRRSVMMKVQAANDAGIAQLRSERRLEDLAANAELSEPLVLLSNREQVELEDIDAALAKIERRTWGVCETCGARIDAHRLEVMPEARTCLAHAR